MAPYTGDVVTGCDPDVRLLDEVAIHKMSVGPMDNNAYLLTCHSTGAQLLIDAAADPQSLMDLIDMSEGDGPGDGPLDAGPPLDLVVTTHRHADHFGALADIVAVTGARTVAGADDAASIAHDSGTAIDLPVSDGDTVTFGRITLDVIQLRGHTPGSIALAYTEPDNVSRQDAAAGRAHLFTGDALFPGGLGNTHDDRNRFATLLDDVTTRIFDRYRDDTWVYPGHGVDTTLGAERPHLDEWRARGW
ncbi:MBL fold metallo-hydrolase [Myceligenerans salitolerans]|uniref:MBL fold metallo-hydrolase n=1 Tax=Myceligenerans salitolerans TaxID=1230528 RepID=A0ABS3IBY4_9MICO|nr:MBL fold metallo-hydrolase [Myceligenerans salitolerans]MBO0610464.1 MBL fold metallo-hydrolase [Myceligenerans salitolerans]